MRVHNFGAGPATLPLPVLERIQSELLDYQGSGMSILECSHRGPHYDRVHRQAIEDVQTLLGCADSHDVLFMAGGARTQFSAVPMNLLPAGAHADYVTTGRWSEMALEAAIRYGDAREVWSAADSQFDRVPDAGTLTTGPGAAYLHYTSNNTIRGTQFHHVPEVGAPLACDMSSDIMSRPVDVAPFGVIYAGAQKNLGPAGVTLVLVRKDLLDRSPAEIPETLSYKAMAAKSSLLNTPPVFAIYAVGLVLRRLCETGGLAGVEARNRAKADLLYGAIDASEGYYRGHARRSSRSWMNVTFRLPDEESEQAFLTEAAESGLVGLKGHRSVGGVRASLYNSLEARSVEALVEFMAEFQRARG